jgi:hypothetical protein
MQRAHIRRDTELMIKRHSSIVPGTQSFKRAKPSVVDPDNKEDLYKELSRIRDFFMAGEDRKQPTWTSLAKVVLKKSKLENTREIMELFIEAASNKRKEMTMETLRSHMLKLIKKKQVEIHGKEPETLEEQIQNLSDPHLRKKFAYLDSKYREIKNEIQNVNALTDNFGEYLNLMKKKSTL